MTIRASAILVCGLVLVPVFAQTLPGRGTGNADHPQRQRQGFGEYALGKINPGNADLGASYQAARDRLVEGTLDDVYFWSNCVSLTLLVGVTGFCLLNLRASDKKERIAATLIAQMWNGRVSDRIEIERRTKTYNALVDSHNELVENSLAPQSVPRRVRAAAMEKPEMDAPVIEMASAPVDVSLSAKVRMPVREEFTPTEPPPPREPSARKPAEMSSFPNDFARPDQQATTQEQEIKRLRSQVQALQSREANLLVRINSQEELKNQSRKHPVETKSR